MLSEAIALADEAGLEATTMRRLAERLGVTPMALYKHVASRDELVDGMVDEVISALPPARSASDWRAAVRRRILSARRGILRHPWATEAIRTRTHASPVVLAYMDELMGMLRAGGFSLDLLHNAMHALSTRMWGFTVEVFPTPATPVDAAERDAMLAGFAATYPNIVAMAAGAAHAGGSCDSDAEFAFALDLLLDGLERHRLAEAAARPDRTGR